jgi:phosphatidylglycerol:prolipoprotein diacylglycerol transferase
LVHPELLGVNVYVATTVMGYAIAVAWGFWLGMRDQRDPRDLLELGLVVVLSAVLGAKIFHTLFEAQGHNLPDGTTATGLLDLIKADPWHWARLFESGYVFYGGVVVAIGFTYLYTVRAGLPDKGSIGDYAAPGLALGIAIGRTGCFLAGCCYGTETDVAWAVVFPVGHASGSVPIHPVQLYDVFFGLSAAAACVWYYPRRRFGGDLFGMLVMAYAAWRFGTEIFRGDGDRGVWFAGSLSTSQLVSLAVLPVTVFFWNRARKLARGRTDAADTPDSAETANAAESTDSSSSTDSSTSTDEAQS